VIVYIYHNYEYIIW